MYHNKELIATRLYEILDDLILEGDEAPISIDKLLKPSQKYSLIMSIIRGLPLTDLEMVMDFHNKFQIPKEYTSVISNFKSKELRFKLIFEESLELAFALGFSRNYIYDVFIDLLTKVEKEEVEMSLTNTLDALLDLLFVTYGAIDIFNLTSIYYKGMEEVYESNMSKLIPVNGNEEEVLKKSIATLKTLGYEVESVLLNKHISIVDKNTRKIMKPVTYFKPDLAQLVYNYLKNKKDE